MKKIVFLLMTFGVMSVSAQDVIVKRNGDELQCKILEVSKNEVRYKRWTNQEGPAFTEKKSDIFMIKYENGEKDVMAYETPALEAPSAVPSTSSAAPGGLTIAEPTPISNVYLKYKTFGGKSGIIKWGHPQTTEQAQNILTKDWLDYKEARKDERAGKIMAFTGGTLFLGGLGWTVVHSVACKRYRNAKREYEEMDKISRVKYNVAVYQSDKAYEKYKKAKKDYDDALEEYRSSYSNRNNLEERNLELNESEDNLRKTYKDIWDRSIYFNYYGAEYEIPSYEDSKYFNYNLRGEMNYWAYRKNRSYLIPMIGGLATGTPLLIVGIIKAKRGHRNATQIVNKHIDEYEQTQGKTSMSKPEFDIDARGNNLVFSLKF